MYKFPLGIGYRAHAEILGLPFHLPCCELEGDQSVPGLAPIKIVADQHRAAEAVREQFWSFLGHDILSIVLRLLKDVYCRQKSETTNL